MCRADIEHTIQHLEEWMAPKPMETPLLLAPSKSYLLPEPLGVICDLGAWNYPFGTLLNPLVSIIASGNCAVIKPSEMAPRCSIAVAKLCEKYLDQKFYRVVQGHANVAIKLTSMRFDMFVFTGSTQKGKLVAQSAAKNLVPCILELGGKSPCIIDESCDATFAGKKALIGKMMNYGQICIAPDYLLVHESKLNEFVKSVNDYMADRMKNCHD